MMKIYIKKTIYKTHHRKETKKMLFWYRWRWLRVEGLLLLYLKRENKNNNKNEINFNPPYPPYPPPIYIMIIKKYIKYK
jgi:hypothetical protein